MQQITAHEIIVPRDCTRLEAFWPWRRDATAEGGTADVPGISIAQPILDRKASTCREFRSLYEAGLWMTLV